MMDIKRLKVGQDSLVKLFDLKTGKEILTTEAHNITINQEERSMSMEIREEYDRFVEAGFITPSSTQRNAELTSCFLMDMEDTHAKNYAEVWGGGVGLNLTELRKKPVVHHSIDVETGEQSTFIYDELNGAKSMTAYISAEKPKDTIGQIYGAVASINPCKQFLEDVYGIDFDEKHYASYRYLGMDTVGMRRVAEIYPTEPVTPVERKKKYNDGLRKMFNKGKKW